jgi:hypothetical protein
MPAYPVDIGASDGYALHRFLHAALGVTRQSHLPQTFYSQLSIYVVVNIVLVLAAVAAEGAR